MTNQTLDTLAAGRTASVAGIAPSAGPLAHRLIELGFDEGALVEVIHQAPLGDPIAVRVDGSVVALRRALAHHILLADAA
ncbi:FeoA family protein [Sandaracinobacter neustonicus]|uniref:FeoA family protein n=1 Tax=Sandaracinobacter neustonicus TaxID=1715348 RepID=UPI001A9C674C|nr:FeoA family protein [Sandaracinobacter neustonicus]